MQQFTDAAGMDDPRFDCWHILLADERCAPEHDKDSTMKALRALVLDSLAIPAHQIHAIDYELLQQQLEKSEDTTDSSTTTTAAIAQAYAKTLEQVLQLCGGYLDMALLGFGPDGHTCSLFPNHALLKETTLQVAPITDSPKPPSQRITLTFPVLNERTRSIVFCGAGASKQEIVKQVFASWSEENYDETSNNNNNNNNNTMHYKAVLRDPPPFPCGMVRPNAENEICTLTWIIDVDAMPKGSSS